MFRLLRAALLAASFCVPAGTVLAGVITPVSVVASEEFPFWGQYRAVNVINGSGLNGGLHDGDFNNMWMTDLGTQAATLTFDLGAEHLLSGVNIWNYNVDFGLDRGAREFVLSLSLDGSDYDQVLSSTLAQGTGTLLAAQSFAFSGIARYVRLDILNNYGDQWSAVGLGEVNFTAVPEPGVLPLLAAGLGLIGLSMRRRA